MSIRYLDAHLHLQDKQFTDERDEYIGQSLQSGVRLFFCNAISESDWLPVVELASRYPAIVPFLGIHPWYADNLATSWQSRLQHIIEQIPGSGGIGEIGLDKACQVDFNSQLLLFHAQLELAVDQKHPVAIHCVRCWGQLLAILESYAQAHDLPAILIHAFNGSKEIMERLVRLGCFISFCSTISDPKNIKLRNIFASTPLDRILLETDAPYYKYPAGNNRKDLAVKRNDPAIIRTTYFWAARQRKMLLETFANQIWQNATIFTHQTLIGR
jgi:TatD DNase family protein